MPYEGQHDPKELKQEAPKKETVQKEVSAKSFARTVERKVASAPTGSLSTTNIGIKSTLNPRKKNNGQQIQEVDASLNEQYSQEDFDRAWKEFALQRKREKKDSLYTTLTNCPKNVGSNHLVSMDITNSIQQTELEECKGELVRFLRNKLSNAQINLEFKMVEQTSAKVMDSKSTFDQLSKENSSLNKFRKLFNLDIEF